MSAAGPFLLIWLIWVQFCVYRTLQDVQKVLQVRVSSSPAVSLYCFLFLIPWHGETKQLPLDRFFKQHFHNLCHSFLPWHLWRHFCSTTTSVHRRAGGKCSCFPPLCFTAAEVASFFCPTTTPRHRNTTKLMMPLHPYMWAIHPRDRSYFDYSTVLCLHSKTSFIFITQKACQKKNLCSKMSKNVDVELLINGYDQDRMQNSGGFFAFR